MSAATPRTGRAPRIDDDVTGKELDKEIRVELSTLAGPVAGTVARHLVMAGRLLDTDPDLALEHVLHARTMAGRVAVVREAAGVAAYEAGRFDVALSELRAARRMSGRADYLALMADCERGVGRPERAVELAAHGDAQRLDAAGQAELAIVAAGAERDMGRPDDAEHRLRAALLLKPRGPWVARVQYALGDLLAEQSRVDEAVAAFTSAEAADVDGVLGAGERLVELLG
jgi:tetratricopeptide (TPR) repeat protein